MTVGNLVIDEEQKVASIGGVKLELRPKHLALLMMLAREPGHVITRWELKAGVWLRDFDTRHSRTLDVHVCGIRRQLKLHPGAPAIVSHKGLGYSLEVR